MGSETELAWAAGFIDGEGYCALCGTAKNTPILEVAQSGESGIALLERVRSALGVGQIYGPIRYKTRRWQWRLRIYGAEAVGSAFAALRPFLGPIKTKQIGDVLAAHDPRRLQETKWVRRLVPQVRSLFDQGWGRRDIADAFGLTRAQVYRIGQRESYTRTVPEGA